MPSAFHCPALPAGSLYSTFATCYMKLAGDDLELGPSFQQHLDKSYEAHHMKPLFKQPTAAEVSAPKLHLNHPDIRDNGLYQVKQQESGGACCCLRPCHVTGRWPCPEPCMHS